MMGIDDNVISGYQKVRCERFWSLNDRLPASPIVGGQHRQLDNLQSGRQDHSTANRLPRLGLASPDTFWEGVDRYQRRNCPCKCTGSLRSRAALAVGIPTARRLDRNTRQ